MTGAIVVYSLMGLALLVGSLVSLSSTPAIRRWRNLAMLAILVLGLISLFVVGWFTAVCVWLGCAIVSALQYKAYDLLARAKSSSAAEDPPQSFILLFLHGIFVWPLIFLEGFEYLCTELFPERMAPPEEYAALDEDTGA